MNWPSGKSASCELAVSEIHQETLQHSAQSDVAAQGIALIRLLPTSWRWGLCSAGARTEQSSQAGPGGEE